VVGRRGWACVVEAKDVMWEGSRKGGRMWWNVVECGEEEVDVDIGGNIRGREITMIDALLYMV